MVHLCECGFATTGLAVLKDHVARSGHRERVPWWSLFAHVVFVKYHRHQVWEAVFMISNGNSFGSSAASVSDGGESGERPGNSWLFRVCGVQKLGNAL